MIDRHHAWLEALTAVGVYGAVADAHASPAYARIRGPQEIVGEIAGRARAIVRELDSSGGRR